MRNRCPAQVIAPLAHLPPPNVKLVSTEQIKTAIGTSQRYNLTIANWSDYPDKLFSRVYNVTTSAGTSAARAWVYVFEPKANNQRKTLFRSSSLKAAKDLSNIRFSVALTQTQPSRLLVVSQDRVDGTELSSDLLPL